MSVGSTQPIAEAAAVGVAEARTPGSPAANRHRWGGGIRGREGAAGWLFVSPVIVILSLFLVIPVIVAIWVSVSDWSGKGSPLTGGYVGLQNYQALLTKPGLAQRNLAISLRNNFYYVVLVVPLQTILALFLASVLNVRRLRAKSFFRTAFYFPSVTSSVAIVTIFLFLFAGTGVVNKVLSWFGINGPNWFNDPRGVLTLILSGLGLVDPTNPPGLDDAHLHGRHLAAMVGRAVGGDVRADHPRGLDHRRHLHAAVPRCHAGHTR